MRLEVRHEDGVAGIVKEARPSEHDQPVGPNAMQEEDGAASAAAGEEPGVNQAAGLAREVDVLGIQRGGGWTDPGRSGEGHDAGREGEHAGGSEQPGEGETS